MAAPPAQVERGALVRSILVTTVLGGLGIVWGLLSGSQMILLDGLYAAVGIAVSWLLLRASALAQTAPTRRYPYGRESVVPLVIGVQGFVLLTMLAYAAVEAVFTILDGGSQIEAGWAIAYGVITTVGSVAFWWWLRRAVPGSDVVAAESTAWKVGALRGVGMIVGFSTMAILAGSRWDEAVPYVDPGMVLVTCVAFLPAPISMVRSTVIELLEGAPSATIQAAVVAATADVLGTFGLRERDVYMTKVGPKLYVDIEGVVDGDVTVDEEHRMRRLLEGRLDDLPYEVWLRLELRPSAGPA